LPGWGTVSLHFIPASKSRGKAVMVFPTASSAKTLSNPCA
jgi:hypothetical protein